MLTGVTTDEAATVIRRHSGQRAVRAAQVKYVRAALETLGKATVEGHVGDGRLSLRVWARDKAPQGCYLVWVTKHYVVVSVGPEGGGVLVGDNQSVTLRPLAEVSARGEDDSQSVEGG